MTESGEGFQGNARFRLRRPLGSGAFGTVYEVEDRQQETVVALKTLHRFEPQALLRFKQEFRALAELQHPNLVSLYELFSDGAYWYFTMELVVGVDFVTHFRGPDAVEALPALHAESVTHSRVFSMAEAGSEALLDRDWRVAGVGGKLDFDVLRHCLRQLVEGVQALHDYGILHRDIKPSNVLVTNEPRVVLFDFGLATHTATTHDREQIVGTPAYMSPEQACLEPISEASDWYSLGVMLYETLTGYRPFAGGIADVLRQKETSEPPPPSALAVDVPDELDWLCRSLLSRNPALRPAGTDILLCLTGTKLASVNAPAAASFSAGVVGRTKALRTLGEAYQAMRGGATSLVRVHGASGIGKTALVRSFLDSLSEREPDTTILVGRCFERESVPYKAMDSLIDALSRSLERLPRSEVQEIVPADMAAVVRLFPVLGRTAGLSEFDSSKIEGIGSQELRLRAFAAMRELVRRIARRGLVVMFIDDLQWGDLDSAALLAEILRGPAPPPLMFIGTYRTDEVQSSTFLKEALPLLRETAEGVRTFELEIEVLPFDEARALAAALIRQQGYWLPRVVEERALRIAGESAGNPFFIDQLVRHGGSEPAEVSLEEMIHRRVQQLPEDAARLLRVAAVAAQPIPVTAATAAASLESGPTESLTYLKNAHFIRTRETDSYDEIEPYHDRIRESVVARMSDEALRVQHHRLAIALEKTGRADPETLLEHFRRGGEAAPAARYAQQAARQASDALAFDRAVRLFRIALSLEADEATRHQLRVRLGQSLANAGHGTEAAETLLTASAEATEDLQVELRRQAGEQYLISGRISEGLRVLREVLRAVGVRAPRTPRRALVSLLFWQAFLRLRGLGFRMRSKEEVPPSLLRRIDVCYSVCRGLGLIDVLYGLEFQARHLVLALKAGEPYRISRALGFEAASAATGEWTQARSKALLKLATDLAERIQHPHALGLARLNTGLASVLKGEWEEARRELREARRVLREGCVGVRHEFVIADIFEMDCLFYLGELEEYFRRLPELLREARTVGDLYAEANFRMRYSHLVCLQRDDPDGADSEIRTALAQWPQEGFHVQHTTELFRRVEFAIYRGDPESVWRWSAERWVAMKRSLILRVQVLRILALDNRARLALSMAKKHANDPAAARRFLEIARGDARRLSRERAGWASAMAMAVEAGIASSTDQKGNARILLANAEERFHLAGMTMHGLVCRRRRAELLGGDEGRALVASVDDHLRQHGVRRPDRWVESLLPGLWSGRD